MARRTAKAGESLELLLDTICNVFGGIVLMAILVVLQTHAATDRLSSKPEGKALPSTEAATVPGPAEVNNLRQQTQLMQTKLDELQSQKNALRRTVEQTCSPSLPALVEAHEAFRKATEEAGLHAKKSRKQLDQMRSEATRIRLHNNQQELRIEELNRSIANAQNKLQAVLTTPSQKLRLPHRTGAARGQSRYMLIKGDTIYGFGQGALPSWTGHPYAIEDCLVTPLPTENPMAGISPIDGRGTKIRGNASDPPRIRRLMTDLVSTKAYAVIFVYADSESFGTFQRTKEALLEARYDYAVALPVLKDEVLIVVPTAFHQTE